MMKSLSRWVVALSIAGITTACDGPSAVILPVEEGAITGTVASQSGAPLAGVVVHTSPPTDNAVTNSSGHFEIGGILIDAEPSMYRVRAIHASEIVETAVLLSSTSPQAEVVLRFPRQLPGFRDAALDVRVVPMLPGPTSATFDIQLLNATDQTLTGLTVHDSLAASFGRTIRPEDVTVDRELFPEATVEVSPSGFAFTARLGDLEPTGDFVTVLRLSVAIPTVSGVFCSTARAEGQDAEDRSVGQEHTGCVIT